MKARVVMPAAVLLAAALVAILAGAMSPRPGAAKPRPTVDAPNGDTCWADPDADKNCQGDGQICYCCYDDGCWICGTTPLPGDTCEWDGRYRARGGLLQRIDPNVLSPIVGPVTPQPPRRPGLDGPSNNPAAAP